MMTDKDPPFHLLEMSQGKVPVWRFLFLSASGGAVDLGYAIEASYALPVLQGVGVSLTFATILLSLGPILGMLFQPFLGSFSDQCRSPCGKRKPFILTFSIMAIIGCLASYMTYLTDVGIDIIYVQVTVVFLIGLFDFSIGQLQLPMRAFLLDIAPLSQADTANFMFSLIVTIYATLGFALGAVPWSKVFGNSFTVEQQAQVVFGLGAVIMLLSLISTLLSFKEKSFEESAAKHVSTSSTNVEMTELPKAIDVNENEEDLQDEAIVKIAIDIDAFPQSNDEGNATSTDNHNDEQQVMEGSEDQQLLLVKSDYTGDTLPLSHDVTEHDSTSVEYRGQHDRDCSLCISRDEDKTSPSSNNDDSNGINEGTKSENNLEITNVPDPIASDANEDNPPFNDDPDAIMDSLKISTQSSIADGSSYKCCKRFSMLDILRTSVIDTLSFIYHMSLSMWIVWFVVFFGFFGDFAFVNAFTTFVGTVVYGGDPKAHVDSDQYQLFSKGVRMGSLALTVSSIFGGIFSVALNFISKWIRVKTILLFCLAFAVVALFLMTVFQEFYFIMIVGLFYGPYLAATVSIPFALIPLYEEKGLLFRKAWRNAPDVIEGKACGVLFAAMFSGQILSSFVVGPVVEAAGDGNYLVIVPCVAVTVTFMFAVFIKS